MSGAPAPPPSAAAAVGDALARSGVPALVLSEPPGLPHIEVLLARGSAAAAQRALARVDWRWRVGGDGVWRLARRRRYSFDGGFIVTVHHALPTGPLPAVAVRRLERALWAGARQRGDDGLLRTDAEPLVVHLAVQAARGALRSPAQRAELQARLEELQDLDATWSLARTLGVEDVMARAGQPRSAGRSSTGAIAATAWRAARNLRTRGRSSPVAQAMLGEPWRSAVTRCRFDGLEVLAGPGTFLPRGVSEQLARAAAHRLASFERPVAVDVGTGCGAIALAIARRAPQARMIGIELDKHALRWARRNARRLGMRRVEFSSGSLLEPLPADLRARVSLIAANVPCLPPESFEGGLDAPARAYVGAGPDGLGLQRRLAFDARAALQTGGWLLVQLPPSQWPAYEHTLRTLGFDALDVYDDPVAVVAAGRWSGTLGR